MDDDPTPGLLRFEHFELRPLQRQLLVRGQAATVGARAFDVLQLLAEQPGQLVPKQALLDRVWPDVVVEENNIAVHISQLRKLLGGDAIATIPGRGYRLTARPADGRPGSDTPAAGGKPEAPAAAQALIGRAQELDELQALLSATAVVTLVGAGGVGKSRLARALQQRLAPQQAHGSGWVDLSDRAEGGPLAAAVASALGLGPSSTDLPGLAAALAPLQLLLVLDGAEAQAGEVARLVLPLVAAAPGLRVLVTSQVPLDLPGEQVFRLGPLALPDDTLPAEQALQAGAVDLFLQRARAAGARLPTDEATLRAVGALCRSLDGLPLAIELAAARVPAFGVPLLLRSMNDRLALLTHSRNRAAPARQQTLRAALEWSHGLLDEPGRVVFRRLAVAVGSVSLGTAVALASERDGALDAPAVLDALEGLVDRSLVAALETADEPRYRLLDSPRALAQERLLEAGEQPALRRRLAHALAAQFDAAYDSFYREGCAWDAWSQQLAPDLDNAREALAWALQHDDAPVALQLGPTLLRALPAAQVAERRTLADTLQALVDRPAPARLLHRAWFQIATFRAGAQRAACHEATARALDLARGLHAQTGDPFTLYNALCARARSAARLDRVDEAEAALAEAERLEDPDWPAQRLYWGVEAAYFIAAARDDAARAAALLRRALALQASAGSDDTVMQSNMIDAELALGHAAAAVRDGRALVARLEGSRHEHDLAFARVNLLAALLADGHTDEAQALARRAWPQARRFELQPYWGDYLSLLAARQGRLALSAGLSGYADAAYQRRGEARSGNEARAAAQARALAQQGLGETGWAAAQQDGRRWRDEEVTGLVFGPGVA